MEKEIVEKAREQANKNLEILQKLIKENKLPQYRALTRKERKKMTEAGVNVYYVVINENDTIQKLYEQMTDWILDNVFPDFDFDDLDNGLCKAFATKCFAMTYSDNLAEKNL